MKSWMRKAGDEYVQQVDQFLTPSERREQAIVAENLRQAMALIDESFPDWKENEPLVWAMATLYSTFELCCVLSHEPTTEPVEPLWPDDPDEQPN